MLEQGRRGQGGPPTRQAFYLPQLDVLRFAAFVMVFVHHSFPNVASGYPGPRAVASFVALLVRSGAFGVDLFFVLSSYLITELLVREVEARGALDVRAFYIRRALRIWPLYFAFLIGGFALAAAGAPIPRLTGIEFVAFFFFVGNWWIAHAGYPVMVFAPLWSLCLEEQFYLLWPLAIRRFGARSMRVAAWLMIVIAILARCAMVWWRLPDHAIWCATVSRLDPIGAGVLLALGRKPVLGHWWANVAVGALGVAFGQALSGVLVTRYAVVPSYAIVAASCALVIAGVFHATVRRSRLTDALVYLGRISFGLYVFHYAVLMAFQSVVPVKTPALQIARNIGALVATIGLASVSYERLENPFLRLKQRFARVTSRI